MSKRGKRQGMEATLGVDLPVGGFAVPLLCNASGKSSPSTGRGSWKNRSRKLPLPGGQSRMPKGTSRWRWDCNGVAWHAVRKKTPLGPGGRARSCCTTNSGPRWCTRAKKMAASSCGKKMARPSFHLCARGKWLSPTAVGNAARGSRGNRNRYSLCDANDNVATLAAAARYNPRKVHALGLALRPVPTVCQRPSKVTGRKVPKVTATPSVTYQ
mmetsp:Transcript_71549/g.165455  ORF Transcript_71549/g.165455 Transcript_71549/m.165455 type:complete len:213 (+) Transcript_71549:281-919(+)